MQSSAGPPELAYSYASFTRNGLPCRGRPTARRAPGRLRLSLEAHVFIHVVAKEMYMYSIVIEGSDAANSELEMIYFV